MQPLNALLFISFWMFIKLWDGRGTTRMVRLTSMLAPRIPGEHLAVHCRRFSSLSTWGTVSARLPILAVDG